MGVAWVIQTESLFQVPQIACQVDRDYGIKIDLPDFNGESETKAFIKWLHLVEHVFSYKEVLDDRRVPLGPQNFVVMLIFGGLNQSEHGWIWKMQCFVKFIPLNFHRDMFYNLQNFKQDVKTVDDYTREFHKLSFRSWVEESEQKMIARYINVLQEDIRCDLMSEDFATVDLPYSYAWGVEQKMKYLWRARKRDTQEVFHHRVIERATYPIPTKNQDMLWVW